MNQGTTEAPDRQNGHPGTEYVPNQETVAALEEADRGGGEIVYSLEELIEGMTEENLYGEVW